MNFIWNVIQMDRKTDDGFVITVHYTVTAEDEAYISSTYGTVGFTEEDADYTPFNELTKDQVIGWVKDSLGQDKIEQSLAAQIEALKNPVIESGLPWAQA